MIDYGILFILLSLFSGILTKGKLRRGYIVSIVFRSLMIIKLLSYIVIVNLIKIYLAPFNGFGDFPEVDTLKYVLHGAAIADFAFIYFIRKIIVKKLPKGDPNKEAIVGRLLSLSLIIYALSESIAIYGLVLFLIAGSTLDFYIFLTLCLVCLGIYFPRYGQWEKWANLQEDKKPKPIWGVIVFVVFFALWIVAEIAPYGRLALNPYGKMLTFNEGELYYTSDIKQSEAEHLGEFLVKAGIFDGKRKSVQIGRSDTTYQFRVVVMKGVEKDPAYIKAFEDIAKILSENVFSGGQVEVHLCDDTFEPLEVVRSE